MPENEQPSLDFEAALEELEALVARMEEGDLPLEEALRQFERGIRLTRDCQRALREAEQKVDLLMEKAGDPETTPFDPES
jgi:exodeoxyribonuclease VII small subunit